MTVLEKIFAFAIPYLIQLFVSNFLEPTVFGKRLNLHPVVVLFALVFWYMMWGSLGPSSRCRSCPFSRSWR